MLYVFEAIYNLFAGNRQMECRRCGGQAVIRADGYHCGDCGTWLRSKEHDV